MPIWRQLLRFRPPRNRRLGLSSGKNTALLESQARKYRPALVCVEDETAARDLKLRLRDLPVAVASGQSGLIETATAGDSDTLVTAVVGTVGLAPTLAAIRAGKRIAGKQGDARLRGIACHVACQSLKTVDSARGFGASAILQCLNGKRRQAL